MSDLSYLSGLMLRIIMPMYIYIFCIFYTWLPSLLSGKESTCQCRRLRDVSLIPGLLGGSEQSHVAGKTYSGRLEEKGTTEDEMAGWHHRLHGRESE